MASIRRKTHHRPTNSPTGPHLLKIIPKGTCKQDILRIPKTFLTKCGDDLANPVVLKVPSGSEWKVELRRWDDGVCFGKGWQKFFEFYSLGSCHSLVFQYEGTSKFRVCILNRNLTEIDYPLTSSEMSETDEDGGSDDNASEEDGSGDDSVEIFDNFRSWSRTKEKTPLSCARPHNIKGRSSSDSDREEEMPEMEETDEDDDSIEVSDDVPPCSKRRKKSPIAQQPPKKNTRGIGGSCKTQSGVNRRPEARKMLERGKHRALQRAKAFKSEHPSCMVVMHPAYILTHHSYLGADFIQEHLVKRSHDNVILRVSNGRTWLVKFGDQEGNKVRFQIGWMKFVKDNQLDIGDVCVFVLIDDIRLLMDVVIFRSKEAVNCTLSPDSAGEQSMSQIKETDEDDDSVESLDVIPSCSKRKNKPSVAPLKHKRCSISTAENDTKHVGKPSRIQKLLKQGSEITATEKDRVLQRAKAFKSDYPSCTVVLHPSYVFAGYLYLEASFTKEHFVKRKQNNVILRASDGRTWPVELYKYKTTVRLYNGWTSFVQDNHLKVHDVCVFVLINDIELVMDVVIFRAVEAANCTLSPDYDEEQPMSQMEESDEDDGSVEILDDFPSCSTRTKKFPVAPQPHQHKRTAENNTKHAASSSRTQKLFKRRPESMESGKDRALQRAKAFKSDYPSCRVVLRPSYIDAGYLYLKISFTKEHLLNRKGDNVILRVSDGRSWPVNIGKHNKFVRFQSGWKPFVEYNHLEVGDVCVFVLVDDIKLLMDVVLFRASSSRTQKLLKRRLEITLSGKDRALQRAKAFKSKWPSCTVIMQSSYIGVGGYAYLGGRFTEKHLLNRQGDTVILRVDGRTWTVQLWKHDKIVRFNTGWKPFVQDNHLEIGDVCVFVLVDEIKLLMDVILFRAGEAAECTLSPGNRQSRSVQVENVADELDVDGEMEADQYLNVDTTSESE